jgi:hypothetical protein
LRPAPFNIVRAFASSVRARGERPLISASQETASDSNIKVVRAISKGVHPTLLTSLNRYNLVEYDGLFYGLPEGLAFDWNDPNAVLLPGVILAGDAQDALRMIRERTQAGDIVRAVTVVERGSGPAGEILHVPQLLGSLEDYNIVSYEGFVYGLPKSLGNIDLAEVDVIGLEGVIRDVSRQVVENEIEDFVAMRQQAAE